MRSSSTPLPTPHHKERPAATAEVVCDGIARGRLAGISPDGLRPAIYSSLSLSHTDARHEMPDASHLYQAAALYSVSRIRN